MDNITLARHIVASLEALTGKARVAALQAVVTTIDNRDLLDEIEFELPRCGVSTRHHNEMLAVISDRDEALFMAARRERLAVAA